jgi:uncharacterized membrane protein
VVVGALLFASAVCLALFAARVFYARNLAHIGLLWNLFLAWLPMCFALAAYNLAKRGRRRVWLLIVPFLVAWLLFLPNAPYLLTDILHLRLRDATPLWYELILLVAFAWTGAFLGLISLFLMQSLVRRRAGEAASWVFTCVAIGLSGFGVYLGRFPRWNSWDVLTSPRSLLLDIWVMVRHPLWEPRAVVFSAAFALCLLAMYVTLAAAMQLAPESGEA